MVFWHTCTATPPNGHLRINMFQSLIKTHIPTNPWQQILHSLPIYYHYKSSKYYSWKVLTEQWLKPTWLSWVLDTNFARSGQNCEICKLYEGFSAFYEFVFNCIYTKCHTFYNDCRKLYENIYVFCNGNFPKFDWNQSQCLCKHYENLWSRVPFLPTNFVTSITLSIFFWQCADWGKV